MGKKTLWATVVLWLAWGGVARADNWTIVDTLVGGAGLNSAYPSAIASDGTYLYVAGTDGTNGIVRRRLLSTPGFTTVDVVQPAAGGVANITAIAYDSVHNRIFVAGTTYTSGDIQVLGTSYHWFVRVLSNHVWSPLHIGSQFPLPATNDVGGIVYSANGDKLLVSLTCSGTDSGGTYHSPEWLVKASVDSSASSYTTIGSFPSSNGSSTGGPIGFDGLGGTVSLGYALDGAFNGLRVLFTTGGSWIQEDSMSGYFPSAWTRASNGDLYYAAQNWNAPNKWLVRKNPGSGWVTVDSLNGSETAATGLAISNGVIYAAGMSGSTWTVRKSPSGNAGTWVASDSFTGPPFSAASAIHAAGGTVWAAGDQFDAASNGTWTVRMLGP